ncbi:MAG: Spy/CpxP family protein refolding chaperone [Xanthobacteraceae bacterium]
MWKTFVAATAAVTIVGTSALYAQRGGFDRPRQWQPNMEDMRAFGEVRLAGLRAGLMLSPEQERNWPAFEQAARDLGKLRADRMAATRNEPAANDPVERMRQRATVLADTGAALKKLAEATDPLYKSLDENQKRRFAFLSRMAGSRMDGFGGRGEEGQRFHHWGPRRTGEFPSREHTGEERL